MPNIDGCCLWQWTQHCHRSGENILVPPDIKRPLVVALPYFDKATYSALMQWNHVEKTYKIMCNLASRKQLCITIGTLQKYSKNYVQKDNHALIQCKLASTCSMATGESPDTRRKPGTLNIEARNICVRLTINGWRFMCTLQL